MHYTSTRCGLLPACLSLSSLVLTNIAVSWVKSKISSRGMEGAAGDRGETLFWGPSFILTFANGASLTSEGAALAIVCTLPRQRSSQYNKFVCSQTILPQPR